MAALSLILDYAMNGLLSQVRALNLITHLMMMQLMLPGISVIVFSELFRFVTFDLISTDFIYADYLVFPERGSYSLEADRIGYETLYFLPNSGSIPYYFVGSLLIQLILSLLKKVCSN